ncbi:MAG: PCRF domain-containing protein, partial [Anaerolineae bacterium]|nr:PCRF domain-containing protein [Anaerolineae bacterium]
MLDKLAQIEARYDELERLMGDPAVMNDYTKIAEYSKERTGLEDIVRAYRQYRQQMKQLEEAREIIATESDADLRALAQEDISAIEETMPELEQQLKLLLLPKDPRDDKNVIMEIR